MSKDKPLFDLDGMKEALASESFTMPYGLTLEEKRQFIKDCANGKIKGDSMSNGLIKADSLLSEALETLIQRGQLHDKAGEEERSLGKVAEMMTALKGVPYTAQDIGLVQICVKLVRSQQGNYHHDNFVDLAGYAALTGEEAHRQYLKEEALKPETKMYSYGDGVKENLPKFDPAKEKDISLFILNGYSAVIPNYPFVDIDPYLKEAPEQTSIVVEVGGRLVPRLSTDAVRKHLVEKSNPREHDLLADITLQVQDPRPCGGSWYSLNTSQRGVDTEEKFLSLLALSSLLAEYLDRAASRFHSPKKD